MEMTLDQALQKGIEAHKAGQVQEADKFYTAILQSQPKHPDANHNMGVLAVGIGKAQEALPFFKTAVEANPSLAQFWLSYIDALIRLNKNSDAAAALDQAKGKGIKGEAFDQLEQSINELDGSNRDTDLKKRPTGEASKIQDPPPEQLQPLINLYSQGQHQQALTQAAEMLVQFPRSPTLYNICGAAHAGLGKLHAAIESYKKAIKIKPNYVESYYNMGAAQQDRGNLEAALDGFQKALKINPNVVEAYYRMGNVLKDKGELDEAINSYKKAIKIKPNHADAYFSMGNLLKDKGELEAAIDAYKQAIKVRPDYAEAYYNMGAAQQDKGNLEVAIDSFQKALDIKPDIAVAKFSLIQALASYKPKKGFTHPCIKANEKIRKIKVYYHKSKPISDSEIKNLYSGCLQAVKDHQIQIDWTLSQTYRSNATLNCSRHMKIFNGYNIIPEYCFGCYKVQIEPRTVLELIKLFVVFDNLHLENNNDRKCMVELRVGIAGFYKGLVFCSSLEEANKISDYLTLLVRDNIGLGIPVSVKRGCSEYSISYPQYKEINNLGPQVMNYNEEWRSIEVKHDAKYPINKEKIETPQGFEGLSLSDFLIMQNWLVYAQEIGDYSYKVLTSEPVYSNFIVEGAKARTSK